MTRQSICERCGSVRSHDVGLHARLMLDCANCARKTMHAPVRDPDARPAGLAAILEETLQENGVDVLDLTPLSELAWRYTLDWDGEKVTRRQLLINPRCKPQARTAALAMANTELRNPWRGPAGMPLRPVQDQPAGPGDLVPVDEWRAT